VNFLGKRKELAITIKLDGFLGGIEDRMAMIAIGQVSLEGVLQSLVQFPIQISANLFDRLVAV
jgi:hypothetical protein